VEEIIMTKFVGEFKKFINRGNVFDMAVGVIVGSAFTAIVTSLTNNILKPVTNWIVMMIFGADSLSETYTFLDKKFAEDGSVDLAASIYIDWGAFINSIFHFIIIAFVLFCLLKTMNNLREEIEEARSKRIPRELRREMRAAGVKLHKKKAVEKYLADKKQREEEEAKKKAEEEARAAAEHRAKNPTGDDLLKLIYDELRIQNGKEPLFAKK
jgi:large conductance mechanosensitive channel